MNGVYYIVKASSLSEFGFSGKGVGIDPLVVRKAIPKHKDVLSEEYLISMVLNATEDEMTILDDDHFIVAVKRKKNKGYVTVLVWVHDQKWRYYVYRVHVMACHK
jgi:hypothetical protein